MLSLTRREKESFTIGDNIEVIIVKIRPGNVRIGIDAPKHIPIIRDDAHKREKRESSKMAKRKSSRPCRAGR